MQEDRPKTILQTQNSVESVSITAVLPLMLHLFLLPWYYRDVCSRYRYYRGKIYSVVPFTVVLPQYYGCPHYHAALYSGLRLLCVTYSFIHLSASLLYLAVLFFVASSQLGSEHCE